MNADYIYTHDYTYDFLVLYFLPEIFDPFFREDYAAEIEEAERLAYSRYIAALLPYEPHYDQIIQYLYDKEDAINAPSIFFIPYAICPDMVVDRISGHKFPRTYRPVIPHQEHTPPNRLPAYPASGRWC